MYKCESLELREEFKGAVGPIARTSFCMQGTFSISKELVNQKQFYMSQQVKESQYALR